MLSDGRAVEGKGVCGVSDLVDDRMGATEPTGVAATGEISYGQEG